MLGYLSTAIICFKMRTVFQEHGSRETLSFEEQIMSKDKEQSIFLKSNESYCAIFRNRQDLEIGKCHSDIS